MDAREAQNPILDLEARKISRRTFTTRATKLGLFTGFAGLSGSLLQACGAENPGGSGGPAEEAAGNITVWTWPDNDKTFEETVPIFEQKFPKIKVKVQAYGANEYHDKLLAAIVAGSGPDVAMVEIGSVAKFKAKPGFVDLSQAPYSVGQYKDKYAPFAWGYVSDEKSSQVFALPKNTGPGAMFYRRDLYEQAGLTSEPDGVHELLKDWDAFIETGRKLSIKNKQWMVSAASEIFSSIIAQAGISNFDKDGNSQIRNPHIKTALEYSKKAWDAGLISPFAHWSTEWGAAIGSGTIATHLWGNWFGGLLKSTYAKDAEGKWGISYAPTYNGISAYNSGGDFIGILQSSSKKAAAWEFCKFVTQDDDSLKTMYAANDLYPAWTPSLSESWINSEDPYYKGQQANNIFADVSAKMVPPVTNANDPIVATIRDALLIDVTKGGVSIDAALEKAEQQIKAKTGS